MSNIQINRTVWYRVKHRALDRALPPLLRWLYVNGYSVGCGLDIFGEVRLRGVGVIHHCYISEARGKAA